MKYKLSDKLKAFINDNILDNYRPNIESAIMEAFRTHECCSFAICVSSHRTVHGVGFNIVVHNHDIEKVEELKPYVWYEREKFDNNPNGYIVLERDLRGRHDSFGDYAQGKDRFLQNTTTHFMYIEKI